MAELSIHTGAQGDETIIYLDWFDENMRRQRNELVIRVQPQDKPRTLEICVDGVKVSEIKSR